MHDDLPAENVYGHTKKVKLFREAIERYRVERGKAWLRILDVGCGSGYAVTRFLGRMGDDVMGIDMFKPNIDYAKAHWETAGLRFLQCDINSISDSDQVFDIAVMADVLEHLQSPSVVLKKSARLLAKGGRLLVTVPNGWGPFELESALSRAPLVGAALLKATDLFVALLNKSILRDAWTRAADADPADLPYNGDSGHVQFFTRQGLIGLVEAAGFRLVQWKNLSFMSGPFTNYLLAPSRRFCRWNARSADSLPSWLVSAWFFEFERDDGGGR